MSNFTKDIPQSAFINAEIRQAALPTGDFQQAMQDVVKKYGLTDYTYMNPAYCVSLLYCLIVVPKELFVKRNAKAINSRLPVHDITELVNVVLDKDSAEDDSEFFLRRLRNSIAHVNYEVDKSMTFTFKDKRPGEKDWKFIVTIEATNFMKFISLIGALLANLRTNPL